MPRLSKLKWITVYITNNCNLKCKHCCYPSEKNHKDLSIEKIRETIQFCEKNNIRDFYVTGGEPLLRKDFLEIMSYAAKRIKKPSFSTNGWLVKKKLVKKLKEIGIRRVNISIDGFEETHDMLRGRKGSFKRAVRAVEMFSEEGFVTHVQCTISNLNKDEVVELAEFITAKGAKVFKAVPVTPIGRASIEMMIKPKEYAEILRRLTTLIEKGVRVRRVFGLIPEKIPGTKIYECGALRHCVDIAANGDVYPCSFLPLKIGNIYEQPLEQVLSRQDGLCWLLRMNMKELKERVSKECKECPLLSQCRGGCLANSFYYYGDLFRGDPYCWVKQKYSHAK